MKKKQKQIFPQDDELSLMQGDPGEGPWVNLDIFYSSQFVQNETCNETLTERGEVVEYHVEQTPVLAGTLTGTLYVGTRAVATFVASEDSSVCFTHVGHPEIFPVKGEFLPVIGMLTVEWSDVPERSHLVASYEYNMESSHPSEKIKCAYHPEMWETIHGTQIRIPTFERFLSHDELTAIKENAATITMWDFNTSLGDTIREKYESFYVKVVELSSILVAKGAAGVLWVVASPEVCSIFEVATAGFIPECGYGNPTPVGIKQIQYVGTVNGKFRLYKDATMQSNQLLMGVNDELEDWTHYGRLSIANFIV